MGHSAHDADRDSTHKNRMAASQHAHLTVRDGWIEITASATSRAPAEAVFAALVDLPSHLVWASVPRDFGLLSLDAPPGPVAVGTGFRSQGRAGPLGRWRDRSRVTEILPATVFAFATDATFEYARRRPPTRFAVEHRYEIAPRRDGCSVIYSFRLTALEPPAIELRVPLWLLRNRFTRPFMAIMPARIGVLEGLKRLLRYVEERAEPAMGWTAHAAGRPGRDSRASDA